MIVLYIGIGVVLLLILSFVIIYNVLVKAKNKVEEAFSNIDVYLKKRYDLIPNLINTVKGYMKHESELLTETTQIRADAMQAQTTNDTVSKNNKLGSNVRRIMAISENYPQLHASKNFLELQKALSDVEMEISDHRKEYNAAVTSYHNKLNVFPNNIIGKMFNYTEFELFVVTDAKERENVVVEF